MHTNQVASLNNALLSILEVIKEIKIVRLELVSSKEIIIDKIPVSTMNKQIIIDR